ncbi:MAG TPA: recombinase family protein [Bacteroidia bacterium]|nr:recombinase family protein [Bacteroidia bacterium]
MEKQNKDQNLPGWLKKFSVKSKSIKEIENNRAVIYNRCSTEQQDSLDWQDNVCVNLCNQIKLDLIKTFNAKESATTDDRIVFNEMLQFCYKNKIGNIVVYSYDRFTRSGDIGLLKSLREKGIKVHAATQSVDDQTPSGRLSQSLYLMFAEMENEQRRDRIIEGQMKKLRKGEWIGKPTIGYIKAYATGKKDNDHDKPQCFIGPQGRLIQQAFMWKYNENLTHEAIIQRLIPMGLTLTPPLLSRIFRNPFYCGYITHSLLDDGEIIIGKHEPLISEEVFLAVNGILSGNRQGYTKVSRAGEMPFKTTVKCGKCGRPFTGYFQKEYLYYKCPNKGCCINVSEKKLMELFEALLSSYTLDRELLPVIKNKLAETYWTLHKADAERVKPMKDELTRLKNDLEKMEYNLATGNITPELFQKVSSGHHQKIQDIEAELKKYRKDTSNFEKHLDSALELACNLLKMWQISNFEGKVRLQKLVFPDGLEYQAENHALRTISVNPIFLEIASYSMNLSDEIGGEKYSESEKLRLLYLRFSSSNFFFENLQEIAMTIEDVERRYTPMPESFFPDSAVSMTGATPLNDHFSPSNITCIFGTNPENPKSYSGIMNEMLFTGATDNRIRPF